jgi:hypothetical protein
MLQSLQHTCDPTGMHSQPYYGANIYILVGQLLPFQGEAKESGWEGNYHTVWGVALH